MPIGLGIGMSHAGSTRQTDPEEWEAGYRRLIRSAPQVAAAAAETADVLRGYINRVQASLAELRARLDAYNPDLLIVIGGDQAEVFDRSNVPNLMIFTGDGLVGKEVQRRGGQETTSDVPMVVETETSQWLLKKLVKSEGFDVAFSSELMSFGPRGDGASHAFWRPALTVFGSIPIIALWENTYDPPSMTANRCYQLGQALERVFRNDPRRIAILGSGGLSHDPGGPRAGWVDKPLDLWFIDQISAGNGALTRSMYTFESGTMAGGTGEIRAWITVAGAMEAIGSSFDLVDYVPSHSAVTGLCFGTWPTPVSPAAAGRSQEALVT